MSIIPDWMTSDLLYRVNYGSLTNKESYEVASLSRTNFPILSRTIQYDPLVQNGTFMALNVTFLSFSNMPHN